jgi:hypothetical protein
VGLGSIPGFQFLGFGSRTTIEIYEVFFVSHAVLRVHGQAQNERDQVSVSGYFVCYCVEANIDREKERWMDGWMNE